MSREHGTVDERWRALVVSPEIMPQLVGRYQQILTELGGPVIDEDAARHHLDRLCLRIRVRGGCWYWDHSPSTRFRLIQNGPTAEPRYLLWRLFRDVAAHPRYSTIASHDGDSACLCPAHSDILLDTSKAALLLALALTPPSIHRDFTPDQIEPLRSVLHEAIERHEIPYRINTASGIDLWRTDVLVWGEAHKEHMNALISKEVAIQQEEDGENNAAGVP